jgi:1-acyl-sn-glycerol-3-phosphate acyltransferase
VYWFLKHLVVGPIVTLLFRPKVTGRHHVPSRGPVLFVSNHPSFIDPVFLAVVLPQPISFLAKSEYFTGRGVRGFLVRRFFLAIRQLPIYRTGGAASANSLDAGRDHLSAGGQLGIYPEGTRSPDGRIHRGHTGAARLILGTTIPVIPVAMLGTENVMPLGSRFPRIAPVHVVFGAPLDLSAFDDVAETPAGLRAATDSIMLALSRLSGRDYIDAYASARRKEHRKLASHS